jgi:Rnl2 family RNA ligase
MLSKDRVIGEMYRWTAKPWEDDLITLLIVDTNHKIHKMEMYPLPVVDEEEEEDDDDEEDALENLQRAPTKFVKYPSLLHEKYTDRLLDQASHRPDMKWLVVEKVHGLNCSVRVHENTCMTISRRNAELKEGDKFYSVPKVMSSIQSKLNALRRLYGEEIIVYGEYCGGDYPGVMSPSLNSVRVQPGSLFYCADNQFLIFDVFLMRTRRFDDYFAMIEKVRSVGLNALEPWHVGSLAEMLNVKPDGTQTRVPELFGLGPLENNFIEGFVIRPEFEPDEGCLLGRMILKNRRKEFRARVWKDGGDKGEKKPTRDCKLFNENQYRAICAEATVERFQSVRSKELEITKQTVVDKKEMSRYMILMMNDILQELEMDNVNAETMRRAKNVVNKLVREQLLF